MIKILKFAKKSWYIMIAIVAMLVVQAYCDLALPEYTSNIVDIGIQYGGIENNVPLAIRESEFEKLIRLMHPDEVNQVKEVYELVTKDSLTKEEYQQILKQCPGIQMENLYILKADAQIDEIKEPLLRGQLMMMLLYSNEESYTMMREQFLGKMGMLDAVSLEGDALLNSIPGEYLPAMADDIFTAMNKTYSMALDQIGVNYVKKEYEQLGIDLVRVQNSYILRNGGVMLLIALVGMLIAGVAGFLASRLAAKTSMEIRNNLFKKVVSFSNGEMDHFSTASLITRSTNDVQQVQMILVMVFRLVAFAPIMGIGGIIKVLQTNASMSWIIGIAVLAISCMVLILMKVAMPKFKAMQTLVDKVNLVTREILTGIPVVRAFSREKHEEKRFDGASRDLMKTQLFTNRAMAIMNPFMMLIMNGITILIIWVGAHGIDSGSLQVGEMMAFISYTMQIVMSFLMITMISIMLPRATVAASRIDEVLNSEVLIKDNTKEKGLLGNGKGDVSFNHVNFRYPQAEADALEDINFVAKSGETTAIIGSTGCGKSTLVHLIPRLYDVTEGSITIDGVDIRDVTQEELRSKIGFVPQKGVLFSGTIASNLEFGKNDLNKEEMVEAATISQAMDFISEKPQKFKTSIAQGGANVSGGQKQRLSIARAIAKSPKVYVFDDSFSALDYKTDIALRKALKEKTKESTVIIVAQRISTIMHAEKIIVLDEGKIAGMGTHEELLQNNDVYRQIASSQLSKEELGQSSQTVETAKGEA